jgi:NAD(P)-dependent dehydrogenase (short-subunit alcohol dehydrogenase family)
MSPRAENYHPVALVTGGSRGVGAATAIALATAGYNVVIGYRNKAARAEAVAHQIEDIGRRALAVGGDVTQNADRADLMETVRQHFGALDVLVLNASGGLERDLIAADPGYPLQINHDAQIALLEDARPLLRPDSTVVFVTSHWAHRYGAVAQLPDYEPVAASKHAGEQGIRALIPALTEQHIRVLVVTGDLIDGTITAKLLERRNPGLATARTGDGGRATTTEEMGQAIAATVNDTSLPSGHTVVVGGSLASLPDLT